MSESLDNLIQEQIEGSERKAETSQPSLILAQETLTALLSSLLSPCDKARRNPFNITTTCCKHLGSQEGSQVDSLSNFRSVQETLLFHT